MSDHKYACVYCRPELPRDKYEYICVDCINDDHYHHPEAEIPDYCLCKEAE